jgi:hypothetical protein
LNDSNNEYNSSDTSIEDSKLQFQNNLRKFKAKCDNELEKLLEKCESRRKTPLERKSLVESASLASSSRQQQQLTAGELVRGNIRKFESPVNNIITNKDDENESGA